MVDTLGGWSKRVGSNGPSSSEQALCHQTTSQPLPPLLSIVLKRNSHPTRTKPETHGMGAMGRSLSKPAGASATRGANRDHRDEI